MIRTQRHSIKGAVNQISKITFRNIPFGNSLVVIKFNNLITSGIVRILNNILSGRDPFSSFHTKTRDIFCFIIGAVFIRFGDFVKSIVWAANIQEW